MPQRRSLRTVADRTRSERAPPPPAARKHGLSPVLDEHTRVLVLGSFPGEASLAASQYYAHPRNHFWPIVAAVLGEDFAAEPYRTRLARLRAHGVGLWDTIV